MRKAPLEPAPGSRWLNRFREEGDRPAVVARELLADVRHAVEGSGEPGRLGASAASVGILRAAQGRSAAGLLDDVLALRPVVWSLIAEGATDPGGLLLAHQRLADVLDETLRYAVDAWAEQAQRALSVAATRDGLTGLLNRAAFDEALAHECLAAERDEPPSLLLLDLDGFKGVNDTLGHAVGDAVLVGLAGLLTRAVRRSDIVARLGGDEFAVLLPRTGAARARHRAERMVTAVQRSRSLQPAGAPARIGLSIGVASLRDPEPAALLAAADAAMYAAKRAGKGRAVLWSPESRPARP